MIKQKVLIIFQEDDEKLNELEELLQKKFSVFKIDEKNNFAYPEKIFYTIILYKCDCSLNELKMYFFANHFVIIPKNYKQYTMDTKSEKWLFLQKDSIYFYYNKYYPIDSFNLLKSQNISQFAKWLDQKRRIFSSTKYKEVPIIYFLSIKIFPFFRKKFKKAKRNIQ